MKTYHPMVWQYAVAKRLRWWMALPFRPLVLVTYLTEWLWKFLDWYEWKIMNRVTIWYANRNAPEQWGGDK